MFRHQTSSFVSSFLFYKLLINNRFCLHYVILYVGLSIIVNVNQITKCQNAAAYLTGKRNKTIYKAMWFLEMCLLPQQDALQRPLQIPASKTRYRHPLPALRFSQLDLKIIIWLGLRASLRPTKEVISSACTLIRSEVSRSVAKPDHTFTIKNNEMPVIITD